METFCVVGLQINALRSHPRLNREISVNKRWSLRVVFQDSYDSQPANGRECNDMRIIAGTAYKF